MSRLLGYLAIIWGGLLLWLRRPSGADFYGFRQRWGTWITGGFGFQLRRMPGGTPPGPGSLIIANHSGFADLAVCLEHLPPAAQAHYISKIEIGKVPLIGWMMRHYGDVVFDRADPNARKRVIELALGHIEAGRSIVLFPEGTRSRTGVPKRAIRPALLEAAIARGLTVHPMAIVGTEGLVESPARLMRAELDLRVAFGEGRRDFPSAEAAWEEVLRLWERASGQKIDPAA